MRGGDYISCGIRTGRIESCDGCLVDLEKSRLAVSIITFVIPFLFSTDHFAAYSGAAAWDLD